MRKLKNLKHIFVICIISLTILFVSFMTFLTEFSTDINNLFIYRSDVDKVSHTAWWQDKIYTHTLHPTIISDKSTQIKIVTIDDETTDYLQSKSWKPINDYYKEIIEKLEWAGVKGIAIDLILKDANTKSWTISDMTKEEEFAISMHKYKNIVIATEYTDSYCEDILKLIKNFQREVNTTDEKTYPWLMDCRKQLGAIIGYNKLYFSQIGNGKYRDFLSKYEEKKEIIKNSTEKERNPIDLFTDADYRTLFCQKDISNNWKYETCLSTPRSVYKNIPWGMVNIQSAYSRPWYRDITDMPYYDWKHGTWTIQDNYLYTLPLALYQVTGWDMSKYRKKNFLNPFFWPQNSYSRISIRDVLEMSRINLAKQFKDSYVFIGDVRQTSHDFLITPVTNESMPWVELHAHFLDGILQDKMLNNISSLLMFGIAIFLTVVSVFCYFYLPTYLSPIFAIAMMIAIIWWSRYTYDVHRTLVDIFPLFLAGGILTLPATFSYRFFVVDSEKRFIENAFSHYIDPKMVEMIDMEEVAVTLWGEQRELTVFFSDIAGFTTISERLSPKSLFWLMSLYLSRMTDILKQEWGTLDKYIWDAVMGFFGAPIWQADHAIRACRMAIAMCKALPAINDEIAERGIIRIDFRIGIASGDVMIGNIGSEDHFNYTVLGDTVNLASRLEAIGKEYDTHCIISEWTRKMIGWGFELRELDTIAVKWKTEWVKIYELLGLMSDQIDRHIYDKYEEALALYRAGKYMAAGKIWELQMHEDPVSRVMMLRCLEIVKWNIQVENGIYHMTHK